MKASEWLSQPKPSTDERTKSISSRLFDEMREKSDAAMGTLPKTMRPDKIYDKFRDDIIQGFVGVSVLANVAHENARRRNPEDLEKVEDAEKMLRASMIVIFDFLALMERTFRR